MKGPFGRLLHDVRRIWECPVCRRRDRTSGQVVFLTCRHCLAQGATREVWMKLVEGEEPPEESTRAGHPDPSTS